jgi:hypothetical protein
LCIKYQSTKILNYTETIFKEFKTKYINDLPIERRKHVDFTSNSYPIAIFFLSTKKFNIKIDRKVIIRENNCNYNEIENVMSMLVKYFHNDFFIDESVIEKNDKKIKNVLKKNDEIVQKDENIKEKNKKKENNEENKEKNKKENKEEEKKEKKIIIKKSKIIKIKNNEINNSEIMIKENLNEKNINENLNEEKLSLDDNETLKLLNSLKKNNEIQIENKNNEIEIENKNNEIEIENKKRKRIEEEEEILPDKKIKKYKQLKLNFFN